MELLYFLLVSSGMTQILVYGKIFDRIRPSRGWFGELFSCSMCTGFWVGVFLWLSNDLTTLFNYDYSLFTGLFLGCVSSGTSYVFSVLIDDNGLRVERSNNDDAQKISQTCETL
jgi:hypothetical protein